MSAQPWVRQVLLGPLILLPLACYGPDEQSAEVHAELGRVPSHSLEQLHADLSALEEEVDSLHDQLEVARAQALANAERFGDLPPGSTVADAIFGLSLQIEDTLSYTARHRIAGVSEWEGSDGAVVNGRVLQVQTPLTVAWTSLSVTLEDSIQVDRVVSGFCEIEVLFNGDSCSVPGPVTWQIHDTQDDTELTRVTPFGLSSYCNRTGIAGDINEITIEVVRHLGPGLDPSQCTVGAIHRTFQLSAQVGSEPL